MKKPGMLEQVVIGECLVEGSRCDGVMAPGNPDALEQILDRGRVEDHHRKRRALGLNRHVSREPIGVGVIPIPQVVGSDGKVSRGTLPMPRIACHGLELGNG